MVKKSLYPYSDSQYLEGQFRIAYGKMIKIQFTVDNDEELKMIEDVEFRPGGTGKYYVIEREISKNLIKELEKLNYTKGSLYDGNQLYHPCQFRVRNGLIHIQVPLEGYSKDVIESFDEEILYISYDDDDEIETAYLRFNIPLKKNF